MIAHWSNYISNLMVHTSVPTIVSMSYKSLLFCPEEKTARLVTQVLSELEFTVTLSNDPQATAQKLANEHFDALVVDIANEEDATLLFKSARDSELNHSSLSVAVVEGQAGVAKAFRIGANLVLTKPINIEQSKGTLRVARGLLRKNAAAAPAAKPAATIQAPVSAVPVLNAPISSTPTFTTPVSNPPVLNMPAIPASLLAQPAAKVTDAPFSSLEVEQEQTPAPEPAELSLLESMADASDSKPAAAEQHWAPKLKASAEPIAASTGSHAGAAVAPALEKPIVELKSAAPLASQEAITADSGARETFEAAAVPAPNFSYTTQDSGNTKTIVKTFVMVVLLAVAGYTAWQRLQLGQYLGNLKNSNHTSDSDATESAKPVTQPSASPAPAPTSSKPAPAPSSDLIFPDSTPAADDSKPVSAPSRGSAHDSQPENIQVDELSSRPEPKITVTPKPQPIVVKTDSGMRMAPKTSQPAPPALAISPSGSNDALANFVSSTPAPMPSLQTLRVSQGVSQGLLIKKIAPIYPPTALQLRKSGSVDILATVAKDGSIAGIKMLAGDPMFARAAIDAVKQWKYRPYLLNGEPVQIETQITVSFKLPN
jgi:protein TonB